MKSLLRYAPLLLCFGLLGAALPAGAQAAPGPPAQAQMLSRTATLALKVDGYDEARSLVLQAAAMRDAQLLDAKTLVNEKGKKHGWLRLRVNAAAMPRLLSDLPPLGKVSAENVATSDQLSDFEALGRRVTRLQQHEQRLGGVLQSPHHMRGSDILYLQERLFRASVDESLLSQQRIDLERSAQDSTLLVELFEPGALPAGVPQPVNLPSWFARAALIARTARDRTLARGTTVAAYAAVYAPFWVPVAAAALVLLMAVWRHRRFLIARAWQIITLAVTLVMRVIGWLRVRWEHRHDPMSLASFPPGGAD